MTPLAENLRPKKVDEVVGQTHLTGPQGFITKILENKKPLSLLFYGPPGSGKTTLAKIYAKSFDLKFIALSAVWNGIAEIKGIIQDMIQTPLLGQQVVLFVDEIHRFNKAQQDIFLPFVENGRVILVGATAENPSFYLNTALLSRLRVLELKPLNEDALEAILARYELQYGSLPLTPEAKKMVLTMAGGDGRYLLNLVENIESLKTEELLDEKRLENLLQKRSFLYDRAADQHYNLISALHKSVRGSDPDAALYWFTRMLQGGEDPLFLARRLIRMASEDVGLADPQALSLAISAKLAYETLGSPEGELSLAQVVVYLALAPKSNSIYTAYNKAKELSQKTGHLPPPKTILNAPTTLMKDLGYGKNYAYDPDTPLGFSGQDYFPEGVERERFYFPKQRGFEREMDKRVKYFATLRKKLS